METPEKILLIRLSSVGDIVLASPVAEHLRRVYPKAKITWLVDSGYESLVRLFPPVDHVVAFQHLGRHRGPSGISRLARELGSFDLVVDLQHKLRTAVLCSMLKPARKLSLVKRRGMDLVRALMGRDTVLRGPHQSLRNLSVLGGDMLDGLDPSAGLAAVSVPSVKLSADLLHASRSQFEERWGTRPVVGIVAETRHATKAWPYEHMQVFARMCLEKGFGVVLLGGGEPSARIDSLANTISDEHLMVIEGEDLEHLAARLGSCSLVVSTDSGPAHMAGVLGVPTVVLFGPTSAERWAPMGERVKVVSLDLPCSPCSNHGSNSCPLGSMDCMTGLKAGLVFSVVDRLIER